VIKEKPLAKDSIYRFLAVVRYEMLWHIRKKKVLGLLMLVFSLATLSFVLPVVLGSIYNRPVNSDPDHVINAGAFLGELGFFLLAIVTAMNSISGEFESGTIAPLLTKPVSRTIVFLGKLFATFLILLLTYSFYFLYVAIGGSIVYGPQNNLQLLPLVLLGSLISTFVWISIVLAIGSLSRSSLTAALGAFGVWLGLSLGIGIFSAVSGETWILHYFPGGGARGFMKTGEGVPNSGPIVQTGTGSIGDNLVKLIINPTAEVNFLSVRTPLYSDSLSLILARSVIVAIIYIAVFSFMAWFALKRAQIAE
jgi:ABC-type transport system involved in multi-copper enzyme maturation permease subunit